MPTIQLLPLHPINVEPAAAERPNGSGRSLMRPARDVALPLLKHQMRRHDEKMGRHRVSLPTLDDADPAADAEVVPPRTIALSTLESLPAEVLGMIVDEVADVEALASTSTALRSNRDVSDRRTYDLISERVERFKQLDRLPYSRESSGRHMNAVVEMIGAPPDAFGQGGSGALGIASAELRHRALDRIFESFVDRNHRDPLLALDRNVPRSALATEVLLLIARQNKMHPDARDLLQGHAAGTDGGGATGIEGLPLPEQRAAVAKVLESPNGRWSGSPRPSLVVPGYTINIRSVVDLEALLLAWTSPDIPIPDAD